MKLALEPIIPFIIREQERWCGRRDLNPHFHSENRFSYHFDFRRRPKEGVRGLDYPFAMAVKGFRRRPSSLYTFPLSGTWLGIGTEKDLQSFPRI